MSAQDDLTQAISDLETVKTVLNQAVTDLSVPATDTLGDQFLDNAVTFLEGLGYTVSAPTTDTAATSTEEATS